MQIKYVKTIVGFFNVYNVQTGEVVNIAPNKFAELFPEVSSNARLGCLKIEMSQANKLFAA